jgi:hypothetical protein
VCLSCSPLCGITYLCRYQLDTSEKDSKPEAARGFSARMRLWSAKRTHHQQDDRIEQIVQPPVHGGGMLKLHNMATLLFWLACCVILLDSHIPSWPLNKVLAKALTKPGQAGPSMPVWGLMSLVYVGLWVLHWLSGALADSLPSSFSSLMGLARKDSRRAAEHYYPYGECSIYSSGLGACSCAAAAYFVRLVHAQPVVGRVKFTSKWLWQYACRTMLCAEYSDETCLFCTL